ncbi:MAG: hypothetical protein PHV02_16005 [Rhodocyclaceae bacterium]|nr:hypothetical protein [Rhodocyclaceae bacterium]
MSSALDKRLANIKARLMPETNEVIRPATQQEHLAQLADARKRGERVIVIERSYGMKPPV